MITVRIPAYNANKTLPRALDSLSGQTYKDFTALIVNDGSTDATRDVMERYAAVDSRVRLIERERNEGVAAARRTLIDNAGGEYIFWLDADDSIVPGALERLAAVAGETGADVAGFGGKRITADGAVLREYGNYGNPARAMAQVIRRRNISPRPMIRVEILKKCRMVTKRFCEDFLLAPQSLVYAKKTAMPPQFIYHYAYNPLSLCNSPEGLPRNDKEVIAAMEFAEAFLTEHGYPAFAAMAKREGELTKARFAAGGIWAAP